MVSLRLPLAVFALLLVLPLGVFAQSNNSAGIGITPATIEEPADPGQQLTEQVQVTNLSGSRQVYYLYVRDISGVSGGGTPVFADENLERTGFELSSWVSLGVTELDLQPGESQLFDILIDVPDNATPGSHFGGIFVSMEPPRMRSIGAAVAYEVANIISIRVAGDAVEKADIRQFSTDNFVYSEPSVEFTARVENSGTVLVRPIGPLEITDMFGREVAQLTFNAQRAGVFPGTERDFRITWEGEGPGFGRYQALLSLAYGDAGRISTISTNTTFWVLPMNIILPALGVLALLLLVTYICIKLYIRSKIGYTTAGVRRVVKRRQQSAMPFTLLLLVVMLSVTALFLIFLLLIFA